MTFQEMCLTLDDVCNHYDNTFEKLGIYAEASFNEFQTNLKEAELKVVTESGTTEDLIFLESEAKEGFLVRSKKIIDKIIEELKEFCEKIAEAIKSFFKANDEKLKDLQKKINGNPKVKNQKIKIIDIDGVSKTSKKYRDENKKLLAKAKVGKAKKEDFTKLKDKFDKEMAIKITAGAVITVGAAIALVFAVKNASMKPDTLDVKDLTADMPIEEVESVVASTKIASEIDKEEKKLKFRFIPDTVDAIKDKLTGVHTVEPMTSKDFKAGHKQFKESMEDEDMNNLLDEFLKESEDLEDVEVSAEEYLEAMEEVLFDDDEDAYEESYDDDDEVEVSAEEYLEAMEEVLFDDDEDAYEESYDDEPITVGAYLESLEEELGL